MLRMTRTSMGLSICLHRTTMLNMGWMVVYSFFSTANPHSIRKSYRPRTMSLAKFWKYEVSPRAELQHDYMRMGDLILIECLTSRSKVMESS